MAIVALLCGCGIVVVPRGDNGDGVTSDMFDAVDTVDAYGRPTADGALESDAGLEDHAPPLDGAADDVRAIDDAATSDERPSPPPRSTPLVCGNRSYLDLALACSDAFRDAGVPRPYRTGSILCCSDRCVLATTCGGDAGPPVCGASGRACGDDEVCCWHPSVRRFRCVSPVPESNCAVPL